ncbi:MAG TPA: GEVED domain-containing protein, partial [Catalimonadaceae bacterium]|nr:GEVED domain-containing protein [Catalimonadaceae bacterium]
QTLSLNTDCQQITGHTAYATQNLPPAFCGGFSSTAAKDVYYSFTANTPTDSFIVQGLGGFDPVLQIYSGTCGALTNVRCSYTPSADNLEKISPGNLVPGQAYFLRVYGKDGADGSFTICGKSSSLLAPPNNECINAQVLPLSTVNAAVPGTTNGATESTPAISCNGNTSTSANDVWYKFVAQNAYDSVVVKSNGFINPVVEMYSGTCSNLNTISCSDRGGVSSWERVTTGDLVPGTTYYVRVYAFGTTSGTFTICAKTPPPSTPVVNDESCDAIGLTLSSSCINQVFSNTGATQSKEPINCQPNGLSSGAADVWFKYEFQTHYDTVIVSPIGDFNPVVEVFDSYGFCNQIYSERCSDGIDPQAVEKVHTLGLNNSTVYIRVYGFNGAAGSFNICLKKADPSVLYDACASAKLISVGAGCSPEVGSTQSATPSTGLASCKGIPDDDVWYKFDPAGASTLVFRLTCEPGFDGAMQIYSGSCAGLTPMACINRTGAGIQEDTVLVVPNLVLDYYVRIYHAGAGAGTGGFSLCVTQASAPSNNNCNNAFVLQNGTNVCSPVNSTLYGASQSNAPTSCGGRTSSVANDVWYLFTVTSPTMEISIRPKGGIDPVIQVFNGGCITNTPRACKDDSTAGRGETLILTNMTVGNSHYFRVYSHGQASAFGDFTVCVKNGTAPCSTQAGTPTTSTSSIVNNGRLILNINGQTQGANVQWQVSYNNGASYSNLGVADPILPDTFTLAISGTQNVLVKAQVSASNCIPASTTVMSIAVRCATVFTQPIAASAGNYISNFTLHTLSKSSTPLWRNGSYEAFTTTSVDLCKGVSYPVTITHEPASASLTRVLWMDLNNDGDFSDQNELIIPPNTGSGTLSDQILIPVSAPAVGNIRVRVLVYDAGTSTPNPDPCFAGPYQSGEIEEYTVILTNPVVASAGADKIVCSGGTNLAGSSPSPGFGVWSVVSGPAVVVSSGNANSPVTGIGLVPSVLVWKVTSGPCVSTDTIEIKREIKTLALRNDTTICEDDSLLLDAGAGYAGYQWVNGNTNSSITVYDQGTYWVQVTTINNCIFRDSVQVNEQICTRVSNSELGISDIEIYPNPSSGLIIVKSGQSGVHVIRISDALGRKVFETRLNSVDELGSLNMVLPSGLKGLFHMEVCSNSKKWIRKLWVQ